MPVITKPCPHCGAELTAALADAIRNPNAPESCPSRPAVVRPGLFGGFITGLSPAAPGTFGSPPPAAGASALASIDFGAPGSIVITDSAGRQVSSDIDAGKRLASYALLGDIERQRQAQREALR